MYEQEDETQLAFAEQGSLRPELGARAGRGVGSEVLSIDLGVNIAAYIAVMLNRLS